MVNFTAPKEQNKSLKQQLTDAITLDDIERQNAIYWELLRTDSLLVSNHFNFLTTYFKVTQNTNPHLTNATVKYSKVVKYYLQLTISHNTDLRDIGYFGRGICFYKTGYVEDALSNFISIQNQNMPYLSYVYGNYFGYNNYQKSIQYYSKEIETYPDNELAYQDLAWVHFRNKKPQVLDTLLANQKAINAVPNKILRYTAFSTQNWSSYASAIFSKFFSGINPFGIFGALLILIIWFTYLLLIHKFLIKKWLQALLTLCLGMLFAFGTSVLTDVNSYILGFQLKNELLNDFIYCIVGIGMIEELMKIIPFLIIIIFAKKLREPIDYIILASISALGFAFIENLIYFDGSGLRTMQGRALSSTVVHMFNSSLVAYGYIIGRFAKKRNLGWYFIFFFIAASVFHGFYDFWLINSTARSFSFITFVWLLMSMVLWVSIINNCLNNSYNQKIIWTYKPNQLNSFLLFGLSAIFLIEYVLVAFKFSAEIANEELKKDVASGLFLLIFLTSKLSKFDVIPNYWAPLKFWDWNLLYNIPRVEPKPFDLKAIVGQQIKISAYAPHNALAKQLPITGEVVKRELLSWEKDWYLVKLSQPLKVGWREKHFVYLKTKDANAIFLSQKKQLVQLRVVGNLDDLAKPRKRKIDFLFIDLAIVSIIKKNQG